MNREDSLTIRNRGYLPHLETPFGTYFLTLRLAGTIPRTVLAQWQEEGQQLLGNTKDVVQVGPTFSQRQERSWILNQRIDRYLDQSRSLLWLGDPEIARIVQESLEYLVRERYLLHAWTIMPNHLHAVLEVFTAQYSLSDILRNFKSYTGRRANRVLGRSGRFWQREYYDHLIEDQKELEAYIGYTLDNPVQAGLCEDAPDWPWSGPRSLFEIW